ncbi:MAG: protein phosphatase 2C domain-containing protein [Salinibacter sp.]
MKQTDPSPDERPSVRSRILTMPKGGASMDEYEDAAAVQEGKWPVRAAVADGATESVFAESWAEILAEGLSSIPATPEALVGALPDWQTDWTEARADRTDPLPWYGAAKAREGAFSTLLGLELRRDGRWRAVSVGDGLLLHLRGDALRRTWPHTSPDGFTSRPVLLPSRSDRPHPAPEECWATTGHWQGGDAFLLVTDAVGAWLLRAQQQESPVDDLPAPAAARTWSSDAFRAAVTEARAEGHLRNDDSTLLVLELEESLDPGG